MRTWRITFKFGLATLEAKASIDHKCHNWNVSGSKLEKQGKNLVLGTTENSECRSCLGVKWDGTNRPAGQYSVLQRLPSVFAPASDTVSAMTS